MTAITLLVCYSIREFLDLSDAFVRNAFNLKRSLRYYRNKRRLQLFAFHCRNHWLRQSIDGQADGMQRNLDIDFAAVEAHPESFQAIDDFNKRSSQLHAKFIDAERQQLGKINNWDIEEIDGTKFNASFYEYTDPLPKYCNNEIGRLEEGVSFTFTGKMPINCERFSINFVLDNETKDIALHINPRLPQNYIVRNTKLHEIWGPEEVSSALPFLLNRGERFSIQVLVTYACYMISVNGHHFAEYGHRIPYNEVKMVEVKGDVEEVEMLRTIVQSYPERLPESKARKIEIHLNEDGSDEIDASAEEEMINIPVEWCLINAPTKQIDPISPKSAQSLLSLQSSKNDGLTLPYYGALPPESLAEGRCLKIEGRVRLLPHSFYINLQHGQNIWPHPTIAFHLNPRFSQASSGPMGKAVVCRNSWSAGSWGVEERSELDTNFRPGRTFSLVIVCTKDSFEVYVNKKFITEFKYKMASTLVDTIYIQGDIKLWNVTLEQNAMIRGKNVRIYHNPTYTEEY
ncbi:uncharacterized protein Dwil_GK21075, isoform A [Drosophila willistoni]|uniref:Galectin n=1 Tax=Drosophila willistoni TaxID=7260 RepID=B4N784_DROWI|nr:galectin-8 isoform X1 [Drosophila willistoni]EDW80225.1 uncharacterized protein Dwil_GK21075, isoform A [Drosophila willistoni]